MQTEFEAKFCRVDHDDIRRRLGEAGAEMNQPMRMMKRKIFDYADRRMQTTNSFVRLRDEGDKVTMTYKQFPDQHAVDGAKEIEITVSDFDAASAILESVGLEVQSYQESKRETWHLAGGEVVLDEWPWLDPYIEVEANSEQTVKTMASQLGLDWADAVFGDVIAAYQLQYDCDPKVLSKNPLVRFTDPKPDWLKPKS